MCGRYSQIILLHLLRERFVFKYLRDSMPPRYNIAPSQDAPVILNTSDEPTLEMLKWGLVPSWAKDPAIGNKMINARAETLEEKPSFRQLFQRSRCLVLADGYYEWVVDAGRGKIPMRIRMKSGEPIAFAGLWDTWTNPEGKELRTFTIVTTEAAPEIRNIHHRMPVILKREHEAAWLDPKSDPVRLKQAMAPYDGAALTAHPVSKLVNSPRNDVPECVLPLSEENPSLFTR